jgi:hypothetical protein
MTTALFLLPVIVLCSVNGTNGSKFKKLGIDEIRYNFYDSSVPPPYHRSYVITLTAEKVTIVVDSYGNIIANKEFPVAADQLTGMIDLLDRAKIKNRAYSENKGCTGGTGESVACYKKEECLFKGSAFYCGGKTSGDMKGNIADVKSAMQKLIPDFEKVLDRQ